MGFCILLRLNYRIPKKRNLCWNAVRTWPTFSFSRKKWLYHPTSGKMQRLGKQMANNSVERNHQHTIAFSRRQSVIKTHRVVFCTDLLVRAFMSMHMHRVLGKRLGPGGLTDNSSSFISITDHGCVTLAFDSMYVLFLWKRILFTLHGQEFIFKCVCLSVCLDRALVIYYVFDCPFICYLRLSGVDSSWSNLLSAVDNRWS